MEATLPSVTWVGVAQPRLASSGIHLHLDGPCPRVPGTVTGDPPVSASGQSFPSPQGPGFPPCLCNTLLSLFIQ